MLAIDLTGKKALVCGAGDGIGKAVARILHEAGATVIGLSRTAAKVDTSVCTSVIEADMADTDVLRQKVREVAERETPIHVLIHNTGGPAPGELMTAREEDLLLAFRQHVVSAHVLAGLLLPGMAEDGYGRIINIISTSVKAPIPGLGVSNTIRGAMASWAKTLSNEWAGKGITVNNLLPGATWTPRLRDIIRKKAEKTGQDEQLIAEGMRCEIPAGRFGYPEELAYMAAFLASPLASYITGVSIAVDGGRTPCL